MDINMIFNIGFVAVIIMLIGVLWFKDKKRDALQIIAYLVDSAEAKFGSGTGPVKYTYVANKLYPKLPSLFRSWVSAKTVDKWIEDEVNRLQERIKKEIESK